MEKPGSGPGVSCRKGVSPLRQWEGPWQNSRKSWKRENTGDGQVDQKWMRSSLNTPLPRALLLLLPPVVSPFPPLDARWPKYPIVQRCRADEVARGIPQVLFMQIHT